MNTSSIVRVYPIRRSKTEWDVPLHCYHICTPRCAKMYVRDRSDLNTLIYILVDNPNYVDNVCPRTNQLERTFIRLSAFDIENPSGSTGPLYDPDMIVIPDSVFSVTLTYPLSYSVEVLIRSPTSNGFKLSELVYSIKMLYQYIYQEEERTSTSRSYNLKKECKKCVDRKKTLSLKTYSPKSEDECSICYNGYTKSGSQLLCGHFYHEQCILTWLETSNTCPLCRSLVSECDECNGTGIIYYNYNGVVIPLEYRGSILNRNTTDGVFGIFGHDFDDLVINYMHYNRVDKRLTVYIES